MQPDRETPGRLGAAMEQRRLELRLRWNQVAERAGMSVAHLSRIRKGEAPPSPLAAASIETALQWPAGTVRDILRESGDDLESASPSAAPTAPVEQPAELTPRETVMDDIMAAAWKEIENLKARVGDLERDREREESNGGRREQKGA